MVSNIVLNVYAWAASLRTSMAESLKHEEGQDLIEYAMLGGLIAAAIVAVGILLFTGALNSLFTGIGNCVDFNSGTACTPGF